MQSLNSVKVTLGEYPKLVGSGQSFSFLRLIYTIGVSPKKGAPETFGNVISSYSTGIRSEDIVLFARKFPIWDLDINNPVKL